MSFHLTGLPEADAVLDEHPFALVVGMMLDQQYGMEHAFRGGWKVLSRFGTLEPAAIAAADPEAFKQLCSQPPAIHRFPGSMAAKVQALAAAIAARYDGDASRIWREARDGADLQRRLLELPGIGEMKARTILAVLAKRLGVDVPDLASVLPDHPTLGDVDSAEALAEYQAGKRAYKASLRADGKRA